VEIPLDTVPARHRSNVRSSIERFFEAAATVYPPPFRLNPELSATLAKVWLCSPFVAHQCVRNPDWLVNDASAGRFLRATQCEEYRALVRSDMILAASEEDLIAGLRRFRNREMVRIAWRDIANWVSIEETLRETSELAEVLISESLHHLFRDACEKSGTPIAEDGTPQMLLVLGMGKLGAWELNFSSDIDLIFGYRREGVLSERRGMSFNEFYTRLAQKLIQVLDRVTEDGFVFRVDMRLRPFGDSGPLVLNFDAMERYYQSQAREWERYAMVKARTIAGDEASEQEIEQLRRPFVYRRYLDYRAFAELRVLKEKITLELKRTDRLDNVKLGSGGIREIEFIGQAFQLIRGGRDTALQERRLLPVLTLLGKREYLPISVVSKLAEAYRFLRTVENRLQQYADQQTHDLPAEECQRSILAFALGFSDWASLKARIDDVRRQVHEVFQQVMAAPQTESAETDFLGGEDGPPLDAIAGLAFPDPSRIHALLTAFKSSGAVRKLSARGSNELSRLLPLILRAFAGVASPEVGLERILGLLEAIASRNVYFALLNENPLALSQLVKLATASAWIVHYIARFPILLDELLDPRSLYRPLTRDEVAEQLEQKLSLIDCSDHEQLMVALRQFKQSQVLRVAATDIMGITPIMVVSDHLTFIAESLVAATLHESWRLTALRHGAPPNVPSSDAIRGFAVIAYGKLGGLELGYGSDLDLVFLHEDAERDAVTQGPVPITVVEFYARVAKRMISLMTTQTYAGTLYDIDLRLRPSGSSGLLVSSLEAYETYQLDAAWTWEQQSLARARFVAGDEAVGRRFDAIRKMSLTRSRDRQTLRREVREMREKMRSQLASKDPEVFDLKQGYGGITDIEFVVHFEVLANAAANPDLIGRTDVVRQIENLRAAGFLSVDDADSLQLAYCQYREQAHRCALQELPALIPIGERCELRASIQQIWHRIMEQ
jgi:glutamate-ammonia-ligase adenylyltransferase